jgi:hypothetical protein
VLLYLYTYVHSNRPNIGKYNHHRRQYTFHCFYKGSTSTRLSLNFKKSQVETNAFKQISHNMVLTVLAVCSRKTFTANTVRTHRTSFTLATSITWWCYQASIIARCCTSIWKGEKKFFYKFIHELSLKIISYYSLSSLHVIHKIAYKSF